MEGLDSVNAVQLVKKKKTPKKKNRNSILQQNIAAPRHISGERCLSTNCNEESIPLFLSQLDILSDPTVWDVASWQKKAQWIYTTMLFQ